LTIKNCNREIWASIKASDGSLSKCNTLLGDQKSEAVALNVRVLWQYNSPYLYWYGICPLEAVPIKLFHFYGIELAP